jgi:hypothetical protein
MVNALIDGSLFVSADGSGEVRVRLTGGFVLRGGFHVRVGGLVIMEGQSWPVPMLRAEL